MTSGIFTTKTNILCTGSAFAQGGNMTIMKDHQYFVGYFIDHAYNLKLFRNRIINSKKYEIVLDNFLKYPYPIIFYLSVLL